LPTLDFDYPDGLGGIGLTREDVVRLLGYPLVIFSGDQDIDGTAENFPRHEAAMAQGPNRFTRAQFYIEPRCSPPLQESCAGRSWRRQPGSPSWRLSSRFTG
jgi:hypothetical protein